MIDIKKCIGCRKGISLFREIDSEFFHVDIIGGVQYKCENSNEIKPYLILNKSKSFYLPNDYLRPKFINQELWWEDILQLAYKVFSTKEEVLNFFNEGNINERVWNKSNVEIENLLLQLAEKKKINVTKDDFPFLLKFKKE